MGGLVIETVRPGVEFTPEAASAFRRADAQVQQEFGRGIGVNSTYRSWAQQMSMYDAWNAYVGGWGPYPGHSKAVHPSESFHVSGLALDSDDWRNARIVQILADNGFIRNRLYVPNENHHFEYIRARDKNYGQPAGMEDDMFTDEDRKMLREAHEAAMWSKRRIGGSTKNASLADDIRWLKDRIGGTTKGVFQSVSDLLGRIVNKTGA